MIRGAESPLGQGISITLSFVAVPVAYLVCFGVFMIPSSDFGHEAADKLPVFAEGLGIVVLIALASLALLWLGVAGAFAEQERAEHTGDPRNFFRALMVLNATLFALPGLLLSWWMILGAIQRMNGHI